MSVRHWPTVTVAVPVLNEALHIGRCLQAIEAQTYPGPLEVLVVDGGSTDETRARVAGRRPGIRLLENRRRVQSAALNIALAQARGEIIVRVDGHCVIAPDYVQRCVDALERTGAAIVGGAMHPVGDGWRARGIAAAMMSPIGAGPARFHVGGESGWVDTVYLGAFRTALARRVGGYREDWITNEDAEFAIRMRPHGGVWFDNTIRSTYTPRSSIRSVAHQFYRYGAGRARTVRCHPRALAPRQLVAPLLVGSVLSPFRRPVMLAYGTLLAAVGGHQLTRDAKSSPWMVMTLPAMHFAWGLGFLRGLSMGLFRRSDGAMP
ncbi:MAG: glycosyltransferase family 2 protein [Actinomycetota bacterium]|nr:glycosyltransferase family 2 protein [Actinomycetota bacterium]